MENLYSISRRNLFSKNLDILLSLLSLLRCKYHLFDLSVDRHSKQYPVGR